MWRWLRQQCWSPRSPASFQTKDDNNNNNKNYFGESCLNGCCQYESAARWAVWWDSGLGGGASGDINHHDLEQNYHHDHDHDQLLDHGHDGHGHNGHEGGDAGAPGGWQQINQIQCYVSSKLIHLVRGPEGKLFKVRKMTFVMVMMLRVAWQR